MIYTVTFNPAIDYVVRLDRELKVGDVNRARGEDCVLGGKGINVSGVLAELGCESVALGFVAGETGAWLERGLAAQGLKTDFVHLEHGMTRINVKIKAEKETELNGAGPDIPEGAMQALETKLDRLQKDDILILAGSIPASLAQTTYERLLARLEGRGVRAVVDATRDLLVNVLRYRPFLIKPNNHELSEIVGIKLTNDNEVVTAAKMLQEKGARNVLVSMAGDGALLLDEQGGVHRIGCPKGTVVNSVGAGDSMVAGFVAGYQQSGGNYDTALRLGTACGSATAFSLGLATRQDIEKLLKTI
ncbi:1-phosphofructokinase [Gemmiger formicilis]|uniref:1-phosphofructokinase n=1 Tax=Gemmiger formicilis TaxID=745368 RepID=UPI00210BB3BA|nr:1-phosphofructokinase [Gemmiger formicilis]MCQ5079384.1 1-phosphofructokinase [Gemmiger formicilis]MCQ5115288.1 1-phosphofructokinase [Gemmiger formicilis]